MELIKLKAEARENKGKGASRSLRRGNMIPAVLYGPRREPSLLCVDANELKKVLSRGSSAQIFVELAIADKKISNVMIKEIQRNPVTGEPLHLDFYEIPMDKKMKVNVPVKITGIAKGVELGGVLELIRHEVEVMCLPVNIPGAIEIDVTDLDIGDSVHVSELPFGEGVEVLAETDFTVLTIASPRVTAEEEAEEEAVEEETELQQQEEE